MCERSHKSAQDGADLSSRCATPSPASSCARSWQSICTPLLSFLILGAPLAGSDAGGGFIICVGLLALAWARWVEGGAGAHALHQTLLDEDHPAAAAAVASTAAAKDGDVAIDWASEPAKK